MTFTYTPGSSDTTIKYRNRIRRLVGDTVSGVGPRQDTGNFTDEEIAEVIVETSSSNAYAVAAELLTILANEWASLVNITIGPRREEYATRAAEFRAAAADMQAKASRGKLYAGGISKDRKETVETDTDLVPPFFTRQLDRHAGA